MKTGLLIGIFTEQLAELAQKLPPHQVEIRVATNLDEVSRIIAQETIDFVFLGCDHDSEYRIKVLAQIFAVSPASEIYIMGHKSDPVAFIIGILETAEI